MIRPSRRIPRSFAALAAAVLLAVCAEGVAGGKGRYGFSMEVETSGFMGSSLERIAIVAVRADSAAAAAGLRAGDAVLAVEGRAVRGAPTREIKSRIGSARVGDRLHLTIRRPDAAVANLVLTARP